MFDLNLLYKNKTRSIDNIRNSDFYQFVHSDLIQRLEFIDKIYQEVVVIYFGDASCFSMNKEFCHSNYINPEQLSSLPQKSADLILFPFGFHWIEDVQKFLLQIKAILKKDGIFICNFAGANSLNLLRRTLFSSEEATHNRHFPHISPFIKFDDMVMLIQQAGFTENIIDCETIELEHNNPIMLMKALKNFGESNAIFNRTNYSITKSMYQFLKNQQDDSFSDQINLISLIASQVKNSIKLKPKYFTK